MSITETIDAIDRLISNNGAVSQIKPLLISLREQAEALEKRVRTLESKSKVKDLEGQVSFLRTELDSALNEIQKFEESKQGAHDSDTTEGEINVLLLISRWTQQHSGPTVHEIAGATGLGAQVAQFHLDELEKRDFVYAARYLGGKETEWYLGNDGRAHLFKRGLLK